MVFFKSQRDKLSRAPHHVDRNQKNRSQENRDEQQESLRQLYKVYEELYRDLSRYQRREEFLQQRATVGYYRSKILEEIDSLDKVGVTVQLDGKNRNEILDNLRLSDQKACEEEYPNISGCTLQDKQGQEDSAPRLFIVLPTDLNSWIDTDPSTHKFRLYFMCEAQWDNDETAQLPQHIHISNHRGYGIVQPQEFFKVYGDYVLRMLRVVRDGYFCDKSGAGTNKVEVPSLDTLQILWNGGSETPGSQISKVTIGPLVNKAIEYLEGLIPPRCILRLELTPSQKIEIRSLLDVQGGDNAEGDLCRHITSSQEVYWMCQSHACRHLLPESLQRLGKFVNCRGGYVNLQKAVLRVQLGSNKKASRFCSLLEGSGYTFDVSIKLGWKATRSQMIILCEKLGSTMVLDIDGVNRDVHPQDFVRYKTNLFTDQISLGSLLRFITLVNYPRHQEQCIYTGRCYLYSSMSPTQRVYDWVGLEEDVHRFHDAVYKTLEAATWATACKTLQQALTKHGWSKLPLVGVRFENCHVVFDLEKHVIADAHFYGAHYNETGVAVASWGCLRKMTLDTAEPTFVKNHKGNFNNRRTFLLDEAEVDHVVRLNEQLQEINITVPGGSEIGQVGEHVSRMRGSTPCTVCLTLFECTEDERDRIIVQVTIGERCIYNDGIADTLEVEAAHSPMQDPRFRNFDFLHWNCDHISSIPSDFSALLLETATQQHPTILTSFTLDILHLSSLGFASVQNVLGRSNLGHLHISCTPFDPSLSESIRQLLSSIQWSLVKSLAITGSNMDEWMRLWPAVSDSRLLSLDIRGPESAPLQLSHASALFIHDLIYASSLIELRLENIQFQSKYDWELIIDTIDYSLLETFSVPDGAVCQPSSAKDM